MISTARDLERSRYRCWQTGQPTGKTVQVYAADNWTAQPFTNLPRYDGQREIVYSINVTGELSNYTVTVDGMNAYLTHNATGGEEYTRDYTATVTWADNVDALAPGRTVSR